MRWRPWTGRWPGPRRRQVYRPPQDLAEHVIARDRTCRFPHCPRNACRCDLDHLTPWQRGGQTNQANLLSLCCRHHHLKHQAGWTPQRLHDGSIQWISPAGHTYLEPAATYPIDHTTEPSQPTRPGERPEADPDSPPF